MKRRIILLLTATLLCFTACEKKEEVNNDAEQVGVNTNFTIHTDSVKSVTEESEPAKNTQTVVLCLDDEYFYNVRIPAGVEYATDYAKYVYGESPNFTISVVSNVDDTNFGNKVSIRNTVSLTQYCLRSKEGTSGPQEAAILLENDRAVVLRSYNAPELFATILDSFLDSNNKAYKVSGVLYVEEPITKYYIPNGNFEPSVIYKAEVGRTQLFKFDNGCMYISKELKKYNTVKDNLLKKLNTVSGCAIEQVVESGDNLFAKAGDFYLGVYAENYNTTVVVFGKGSEAALNLESVLNQASYDNWFH